MITGTTGFKGAWLAFWLHNLGAKVTGVSLKPEKESILFHSLELNKKINQKFIDITNFNKLNEIVKKIKPDIIFHLAAQSIISKSYEDPLENFGTNIIGSVNILESVRLNKVPNLVYITSDKCYLTTTDIEVTPLHWVGSVTHKAYLTKNLNNNCVIWTTAGAATCAE